MQFLGINFLPTRNNKKYRELTLIYVTIGDSTT